MLIGDSFNAEKIDNEVLEQDLVFRAISDLKRRVILDIIRQRPRITIMEVCDHFPISRFAIMKHLNVLEDAKLINRSRDGKCKHLTINKEPLQNILMKWFQSYV